MINSYFSTNTHCLSNEGYTFHVWMNSNHVVNLTPPNTTGGRGGPIDYASYYEQAGDPEGAYETAGVDPVLVPVHDPRVRAAPRSVLVGIRLQF